MIESSTPRSGPRLLTCPDPPPQASACRSEGEQRTGPRSHLFTAISLGPVNQSRKSCREAVLPEHDTNKYPVPSNLINDKDNTSWCWPQLLRLRVVNHKEDAAELLAPRQPCDPHIGEHASQQICELLVGDTEQGICHHTTRYSIRQRGRP